MQCAGRIIRPWQAVGFAAGVAALPGAAAAEQLADRVSRTLAGRP